MRVVLVPLLVLALAGCNNGGGTTKTDGGVGGVGPITTPTDMAMKPVAGDMAMAPQGATCYQILMCAQKSDGSTGGILDCLSMGTTTSRKEFTDILNCFQSQCGNQGADAGTTPCEGQEQCTLCVGSGTSPTGQANGTCTNSQSGGGKIDDPLCGKCVDQLLTCVSDS